MSYMHPDGPDERRTVTRRDLGKEVVTCYGASVGTVSAVDERTRRIRVELSDGGAALLEPAGADVERIGSAVELRPEDVEVVAPDRVWLRV